MAAIASRSGSPNSCFDLHRTPLQSEDKVEYEYETQVHDTNSEPSYVIFKEVESVVVKNMVDSGEIHGWWVVSICRCCLVSLGWVVFAVRPFKHRLLERVQELRDDTDSPSSANP